MTQFIQQETQTRHEDSEEEEKTIYKNMIILSSMFTSEKAKINV